VSTSKDINHPIRLHTNKADPRSRARLLSHKGQNKKLVTIFKKILEKMRYRGLYVAFGHTTTMARFNNANIYNVVSNRFMCIEL